MRNTVIYACVCGQSSYTIYVTQDGCSIFHPVKFEQTNAHQRVLLRRASVIEGIAVCLFVCLMVFNATFNNISVLSWRSVLLVDETGELGENHRPVSSH